MDSIRKKKKINRFFTGKEGVYVIETRKDKVFLRKKKKFIDIFRKMFYYNIK